EPKKETPRIKRRRGKGALLLGAVTMAGTVGMAQIAAAASCGDLNNDTRLTIADAVRLQRGVLSPQASDCGGAGTASCGDVNPSVPGVDGSDVTVLLANINGSSGLFALCTGVGTDVCSGGGAARGRGGGRAHPSTVTAH